MNFSNGKTAKNKATKSKVNVLNYMTPLLYKRLKSIIDMSFYETSNTVDVTIIESDTRTLTSIEPEQYTLFELNVEPVPEIRNLKVKEADWMIPYKMKPQLERVVWRSKLYSKEKTVSQNQALVERTENQVDIALRKFCSWFHAEFQDEHSHMTDDYIEKLFSSGFEIHPAAQSIYIEPKQVLSIPHEVAEKYDVPELSTKNQKKKLMNLDDPKTLIIPKNPVNIAFGKYLPASLKHPKRIIDDCMQANFPDELRTDEYLFKGIEGLRSTKALVKHLSKSDMVKMKPLYFKNFNYEDDEKYVPLYKKLENKM